MKSILAVVAALALAVVSADNIVTITSPLQGTTFKAGQEATITWIDPKVQSIPKIVLDKGPATRLQPVADVASNVPTGPGSFKWTIPANTVPGDDYAFALGVSPDISYTGHITITAADGAAPAGNGTAATTGAATTTAAGSASTTADVKPTTTATSLAITTSSSAAASGTPNGSSAAAGSTTPSAAKPTNAATKANPAALGALALAGVAAVALI
ncbi:hypothetical protein DFQ28_005089 [Apophysomyces sp. BC1034]|nr:hypothetical protein DFQ30_010430 [Apophysomyces sp. BC1015]KAG0181839.1 hypothetical protein DFQ29_006765 [Apophysomyces sp. BC1021]KAG0193485.1 hypothetical protein DFQ28_005089 [Apophysomyces sp. BC1034]